MRRDKTIIIEKYGINISLIIDLEELNKNPEGGIKYAGGEIVSKFSSKCLDRMILIHASEGIDVTSEEYIKGIDMAVRDIGIEVDK